MDDTIQKIIKYLALDEKTFLVRVKPPEFSFGVFFQDQDKHFISVKQHPDADEIILRHYEPTTGETLACVTVEYKQWEYGIV